MLKSCLKYSLCFTLRALYPSRALRALYARFSQALTPKRKRQDSHGNYSKD
jgi:hypothetical protein